MTSPLFSRRSLAGAATALLVLLGAASARAQTAPATAIARDTAARLDLLRAVRTGQGAKATDLFNRQMDETWSFFSDNKEQVLPILRSELKHELGRDRPNDMVLLDVGFFVLTSGLAEDKPLAFDALFRLDARAPVIQANSKELFEFAHAAARAHDARTLSLIQRAFLSGDPSVFIPQHALTLDGTLICVFLYGAYGPESEGTVRAALQNDATRHRALEILVWLGTPASLADVASAYAASPGYDTFARVTAYMMQAAGPAGREYMLSLSPSRLDAQSRQYLAKIHPAIVDMAFSKLEASLARLPGDAKLSDAEVQARLRAMIANLGKDEKTSPLAILDSGLRSEALIADLLTVRSRMLNRLSDEALSDVEVTNALINALRYRGR
jgi:hypothetical protein